MVRVIIDWLDKEKKAVIFSEFLENIRSMFFVKNSNKEIVARRNPAQAKYLDDFLCPISKTGKFEIGLYGQIYKKLKNSNIEYEIRTTEKLIDELKSPFKWKDRYEIYDAGVPLRDYQKEGIEKAIKIGYGVIVIGTAGGKTLLMGTLTKTILNYEKNKTALIIIPTNILEQTYKEYLKFGIKEEEISMWGNGKSFEKRDIILASPDILRSKLVSFTTRTPKNSFEWNNLENPEDSTYEKYIKNFSKKEKARKKIWNANRKKIISDLKSVDLIMIDEVHGLRDKNKINDVIDLFDTRKKFGFTGTMPEDPEDQWNIIGKIGPIILNINSFKLREKKYISDVKIQILKLNYLNPPVIKADINEPTKAFEEESSFLYNNTFRNNIISTVSCNVDNNALIMVDRIDHGEELKKYIEEKNKKKVFFIRGSMPMEDREDIRKLMEENNNIICIAISKIFSTGINIKNLHYIIFAQGGKAKITLIQSIGRGLRLHENKDRLTILDISDSTHYGENHLIERIRHYINEKISYNIKEINER